MSGVLITYGDPDKIQFCHLSVRFRKAWPNRHCLGPQLIPCPAHSLPSTSAQIIALTGRPVLPYLSGEVLGRLSSIQNLGIWYNWEQKSYLDERIVMNRSMLFSEAKMTGWLRWHFCTLILSSSRCYWKLPIFWSAVIKSRLSKITVTSLWNRSVDTMDSR